MPMPMPMPMPIPMPLPMTMFYEDVNLKKKMQTVMMKPARGAEK